MTEKHKYQLQHWESLIQERISSGMTVTAWCRSNDLSKDTYYYWLSRIRKEHYEEAVKTLSSPVQQQTAFVELQRPNPVLTEPQNQVSNGTAAIIRKGGLQVEILSNASAPLLRQLLEAMRYV
ncbi:MAG TPA: IS66 family insertion sequence hypothetical protein [Lachnospiraceae bacterium]|nr:IS66 family insertion sequence hypothetical protein [Lachnospiraceae bacterium]